MTTFYQKYSIVCFLESLPNGYEFDYQTWPLHITLADVFAVEDIRAVISELTGINTADTVATKTTTITNLGQKKDHAVILTEKTNSLLLLHANIVSILEKYNVLFNDPQYTKDGYLPHVALQKNSLITAGQSITISHLAIIDMFPNKNGYDRKVIAKLVL